MVVGSILEAPYFKIITVLNVEKHWEETKPVMMSVDFEIKSKESENDLTKSWTLTVFKLYHWKWKDFQICKHLNVAKCQNNS